MGGKGRLPAQRELARNLGIGTLREMAAQVDIDEIVPLAPLVGLELFKGNGHFGTTGFLTGIDITTQVIVNLNILRTGNRSEGQCKKRK